MTERIGPDRVPEAIESSTTFRFKHAGKLPSILSGITFIIIVEIHPYAFCAAGLDALPPLGQFCLGIIMAIPSIFAMEPDIDIVRRFDEPIGKFWCAARAENRSGLAKSGEHFFIPPACVAKFHNVAPTLIELA